MPYLFFYRNQSFCAKLTYGCGVRPANKLTSFVARRTHCLEGVGARSAAVVYSPELASDDPTAHIDVCRNNFSCPTLHFRRRTQSMQVRLADLEKGLLEALATAEGDLLEDTSLIERLSETKATAAEIQVR